MEKVKEYFIGIIFFIIMTVLFIMFLENIYIFGAIYIILFIISLLIFIIMNLRK